MVGQEPRHNGFLEKLIEGRSILFDIFYDIVFMCVIRGVGYELENDAFGLKSVACLDNRSGLHIH
jgi:hypothetical protein